MKIEIELILLIESKVFLKNECENGDTINAFNKTVDKTGISPTITTRPEGFKTAILPIQNYRIRKLTPKECWRLMGFSDKDFYAAQSAGVSNSQLYKQAEIGRASCRERV